MAIQGDPVDGIGNGPLRRRLARILLGVLVALGAGTFGCSREEGRPPPEKVARAAEPLSAITIRTYGFESLSDWSPYGSNPTLSLSTTTHVEGLRSLSVAGGGWSSVISRVLVKEDPAPTTVGFDLRIPSPQPNPSWHGTIQLFISIPSQGINNLPLGLHDLITWTPGQFKRAEFNLPANVQAALNTNFNDLRWRIELNRPFNATAGYLFDRFTYGPLCTPQSDGNPCTTDTCNAQGQQVHTPVPSGTSCSDANACNGAETCNATGTCVAGTPPAVDDGNPCTTDACNPATGVTHTPVPAGTSCSDGNACNGAETCNAQASCVAGTPVTCTASDQCHDAGTCDSATGVCSNPAKPNGTGCNDASACTQTDTCQAGACTGANPVVCAASDQCHDPGACNPANGTCSNPAKPSGSACTDGNACTQTDTCQAGACTGANPIVCMASDSCNDAGTCNPANGTCSNPAKPNGTACNDTTVCNGSESCQSGTCTPGTPPPTDDSNPCTADACDAVAGVTHTPVAAGTSCADADACDGAEVCDAAGTCTAGTPVVCTASDQCHAVGTCDSATGVCSNPAKPDGSVCSDADACTQSDTCQAGTCAGSNPVACAASDQCHDAGSCDPATGTCSNPAKADGSACSDDDACTQTDSCQAGACTGANPVVCFASDQCHDSGVCNPATGVCTNPNRPNGAPCNDDDACTQADTCQAGTCTGSSPVVCTASDQCHDPGTCDPASGACSNPAKPDGSACSDADACTQSDTCQAGACAGANPVVCTAGDQCHDAGTCDPATGVCSNPAKADGTPCPDGTVCNGSETCSSGACVAGTPPPTDDGNPCTNDFCDPITGPTHEPLSQVGCDDGNLCNGFDFCLAGVCLHDTTIDDGNPCTAETCDPQTGETTYTPVAEGTACGDACTGAGTCDGFGSCEVTNPGTGVEDDQNPCTADNCNPQTGETEHVPHPQGTSCEFDMNECNGTDTCDGQGECIAGTPPPLEDGNPCTIDECVFVGSIGVYMIDHAPAPQGTLCGDDDTDPCNGVFACDGAASCNVSRGTDDANSCTADSCDPVGGILNEVLPDGTACSDGSACTGSDTCGGGICQSGEIVDVDGNPCTEDICEPGGGIVHNPLPGSLCDDGDLCNGAGFCDESATCVPVPPDPVDDGNPCTTDSCDPVTGVSHEPALEGALCSQAGDLCVTRTCDGAGTCRPPTVVNPDDGNPCTVDSCNPALGVVHSPAPAATSCANANPCDGMETCDGLGACVGGTPPSFDDANPCTTDSCDVDLGIVHNPSPAGTDCGAGLVCDGGGSCTMLPPDPASVAPPNDPSLPTSVGASTRFLYTGSTPIQVGVADGTIQENRASVIRGRVLSRDGGAIPGAVVEVKDHPELGRTFTRDDGGYDLAVNGGGRLTIDFHKPGFLHAQRTVPANWQDYTVVDDVALVALDANVTLIDFTEAGSYAEGGLVLDEEGERRAAVAFQPGTQAELIRPDGTIEPIDAINVRLTEYTVGPNGPAAMPGDLPPTSHYTYAVDVSADEALVDGSTVQLDRPAAFYVDNFLALPTGGAVPNAYYDFDRAAWIGERDGIVLEVLDIVSGAAVLDVDGSGLPSTQERLDILGITPDELVTIANRFEPGQSFWRKEIRHLTPFDCNMAYQVIADDAIAPTDDEEVGPHRRPNPDEDPCKEPGCTIGVAGQTLRQSVPIAGTPYSLNYNSRLAPGYQADKSFVIQLTGNEVHPELLRVVLVYEFAGQGQRLVFEPEPNLEYTVHWDGADIYGRPYYGGVPGQFRIEYWYPTYYWIPMRWVGEVRVNAPSFVSWALANFEITLDELSAIYGRVFLMERPLEAEWFETIGSTMPSMSNFDARGLGLGGWTLSAQDVYDASERAVVKGDGDVRGETSLVGPVFEILGEQTKELTGFCGSANCCSGANGCADDGMDVSEADLGEIYDVLAMPDGSILLASAYPNSHTAPVDYYVQLRRIVPDGRITTLKTTFADGPDFPNGLQFAEPGSFQFDASRAARLALGPNGDVYFGASSIPGGVVFKFEFIGPDLVRTTRVAGARSDGELIQGNDVPALNAGLGTSSSCLGCMGTIGGLAVAQDGTIYVGTSNLMSPGGDKLWQIGTSGNAHVIAGTGTPGFSGDGDIASLAQLNRPRGIALSPDGSIYVADYWSSRVRRIGADGIITTVAGNGTDGCIDEFCGGGGPATSAFLRPPSDVVSVGVGAFYTVTWGSVYHVDGNGLIRSIAGSENPAFGLRTGPALEMLIGADGQSMDVAPDGSILVENDYRLYRVSKQLPGLGTADFVLPSEDRRLMQRFAANGRHLETLDVATGALVETLGYSASGVLETITDASGNVTRIQRGGPGQPMEIVSPFGQSTELVLDANGYISQIVDPMQGTTSCEYTPSGLMTSYVDARGAREDYTFDGLGRLTLAAGPGDASKVLTLAEEPRGRTVTRRTAEGRVATYRYESLSEGDVQRDVTLAGLTTTTIQGSGQRTTVSPDGTTKLEVLGPDPQFGMQLPFTSESVETTPSGLTRSVLRERNFSGEASGFSETTFTNGRRTSVIYDAVTRTRSTTSPEGRVITETLDDRGRESRISVGDLVPVDIVYDANGRVLRVARGPRSTESTYVPNGDSAGYLSSIIDATSVPTTFTRDALGRTLTETRASATTSFSWDPLSNLASVTPPGKPVHEMNYTPVNLLESYQPPAAGLSVSATGYTYDLDKMLRTETRPNAVTITRTPDSAGRLDTVAIPGGVVDYDYVPSNAPSGAGKVSDIRGPYGVDLAFTYDGRLTTSTSWSGDVTGSVSWQYNNDFQKILETVTGATGTAQTAFGYDNDLLLTCASPSTCSPPGADALTLTRHPQHGMVTNISLGETSETWAYNGFGELARQTASFSGSPLVDIIYDEAGFERDALGRIVRKTEMILGVTKVYEYRYDALRRLDQVKIDGVVDEEFTYDANGNRLTAFKAGQATVTPTYDAQDRLLTYGAWTFTYTANGELDTKTDTATGDEWVFQYDSLGNLLSVGLPNGDVVEYLVDGTGRRVGKKKNGVLVTQWIYRGALKPVAELDGSDNLVAYFVYGARSNVPDYVRRGANTYRVMSDQLGSPRYVVNVANASDVPFTASYTSFGEVTGTGLDWMPFGFAGGTYDTDSGLVRFGARDYEPTSGRWLSKEPRRFIDGPNLYVYTNNDPVNFIDSNGYALAPIIFAGVAIVAATYWFANDWFEDVHDKAFRKYPLPPEPGIGDPDVSRAGAADAYQHCLASCEVAQSIGPNTSAFLGWMNEAHATGAGYQTPDDRKMDDFNNTCGRVLATEDADCALACTDAINRGLLKRLDVPN